MAVELEVFCACTSDCERSTHTTNNHNPYWDTYW